MSISRTLLSGALAAALAAPAMAQTYGFEFDGHRFRHHGHSHHVSAETLRFDPASARLRPGQALHFHVESVRNGRVRRLSAGQFRIRLLDNRNGVHLRMQGDGYSFGSPTPGRYRIEATRTRGWQTIRARMTIDVVAAHRVVRILLADARSGRSLDGRELVLRRGALLDIEATPVCAAGRPIAARVRFSLNGGGHLHALGNNRIRLHVSSSGRIGSGSSLFARVGGISSRLGFYIGARPSSVASIGVARILSCGGSMDAGGRIVMSRGSRLTLRAFGRTRRGAGIGIAPQWLGSNAVAHVDGSGATVTLHGTRRGRMTLTVRDARSGVLRRISVIVR